MGGQRLRAGVRRVPAPWQIQHYTPIGTGIAFLPVSAVIVVGAQVGPRILARVGARAVLVTGLTVAAAGMALLIRISPTATYLGTLLPATLVLGAGLGMSFVALTSAAVAGVPRDEAGVAAALLNASQQVGGLLGLAILTAVASAGFTRPAHPTAATPAFAVSAALLLAAAVASGVLGPRKPRT